jgi:hypothetical protein
MKFVRVENNSIIGSPTDLPINSHNISNFHLLSLERLREYGWYPFEVEEIELLEGEVISKWDVIVEDTKVIRRPTKRTLTQEEIDSKNQILLNELWTEIRNRRTVLLYECDWTQIPDAQISDENKEDWKRYRQDLRDITNAQSPDKVVWPPKPSIVKPIPVPVEITSQPPSEEESETSDDELLPE